MSYQWRVQIYYFLQFYFFPLLQTFKHFPNMHITHLSLWGPVWIPLGPSWNRVGPPLILWDCSLILFLTSSSFSQRYVCSQPELLLLFSFSFPLEGSNKLCGICCVLKIGKTGAIGANVTYLPPMSMGLFEILDLPCFILISKSELSSVGTVLDTLTQVGGKPETTILTESPIVRLLLSWTILTPGSLRTIGGICDYM